MAGDLWARIGHDTAGARRWMEAPRRRRHARPLRRLDPQSRLSAFI